MQAHRHPHRRLSCVSQYLRCCAPPAACPLPALIHFTTYTHTHSYTYLFIYLLHLCGSSLCVFFTPQIRHVRAAKVKSPALIITSSRAKPLRRTYWRAASSSMANTRRLTMVSNLPCNEYTLVPICIWKVTVHSVYV